MSLTILLHSSKTMVPTPSRRPLSTPRLHAEADALRRYVSGLSLEALQKSMHISAKLAKEVKATYADTPKSSAVVDVFRGDIYSGLRALEWTDADADFAQNHLVILSGLYGILRPYDAIIPYRLEAAYKLPDEPYTNLYGFWGTRLAEALPKDGPIINVTSAEYEKLVLPYIDAARVITPKFLSRMNGEPKFVAVHAKIARGAYARWLIQRGQDSAEGLEAFNDLGYHYQPDLSTPQHPVYICDDFKGIGLSQRLV